ncbi:MAG: hypothetical protein A2Y81_04265 [Nitrospirae bacterium RBG_13_43_8]|nr:MAG: hypothetical protein A2Y81_04265 [Nitrospirae bacterium RBG_13_43_8]
MAIRKEVLEILACPKCKGDIKLTEKSATGKEDGFVCKKCKLLYPIREGIPVMLIAEAIKVGGKND